MRRLIGLSLGVLVAVLAVLAPALFFNSGGADSESDPTTITKYRADFTVSDEGRLTAIERITVDFPSYPSRHGIFRYFDIADPSAPHKRRIPEDVDVTMDGQPVSFEMLKESQGRYRVAKIGSASSYVEPGEHTYRITYSIDGVLEEGTDGTTSQFYWNLIPGGWAQRIDSAVLTVALPAAPQSPQCAVGAGATGGCEVAVGGNAMSVTVGDLPPRTPVTVKVGLDVPTPDTGTTLPWTARFDPVFGRSLIGAGIVVLLAAGAALLGARASRTTDEEDPGFPLMYAPPEGIGPAQGAYILTEHTNTEQFVASLMHAAEAGAAQVTREDDGRWEITDLQGPTGWAGLDPVTQRIARLLPGEGRSFVADKKDVKGGEVLKSELAEFASSTKKWATDQGLLVSAGLGGAGGCVLIGVLVVAGFLLIKNPLGMSLIALIPAFFAIFAYRVGLTGAGTKRTATGRDLWSRVGGFRRVLSTPSSVDRFDFSGRQEIYTAYLPWAVAFGCAKEWAEKYRTEVGAEPPTPSHFAGGYVGASAGSYVNSMVDDFQSTLSSSISAYEATQSSSSSGGGGFSGGGGGGGGGGGSW